MSDNLAVEVVRGEMQPWSDYDGSRGAVRGPVLGALLDDVLPAGARTLIVGPHAAELVSVVLAKSADTTLLVRSVSDAASLAEEFEVRVVAGALDGLTGETFDVIVAADGLDRVLSYDSEDLNWSQRLDALAAVAAPDAVVVLGLENEFSLTTLLDQRPADQRHGDDEWRPLRDDPTRPVSVVQLASELARVGLDARSAYASFTNRVLLAVDVAAAARPGELPTRLAVEALEATDVPLLTPISEPAETAARAGLLASTATGWLAITAPAPHAIYAELGPCVLTAAPAAAGWSITVTPAPGGLPDGEAEARTGGPATPTGCADGEAVEERRRPPVMVAEARGGAFTPTALSAGAASVVFDASVVPAVVPGGVSVETLLLRLAVAEDVPGFRALAGRLGDWARSVTDQRGVLRWDDVLVDGDAFAYGVSPWVSVADESREDLLAAAWQRFHDRLIGTHRRHPWPPWMIGDDLVSTWLAMSGVEAPAPTPATTPDTPLATAAQVARGKELAAALAGCLQTTEPQTPDVRTALADAERAKKELFELQGHVFGLERTLGFRDKALKTRENRLREMRLQVQKANAERTRFRNSRAFAAATLIRKAATIRNPRKFAGKVKRHLRRKLRR
ncbi:hypothetical protein GCM10009789_51240 [Kribbella sancticallisti]|uniref:Class I SAM-dependent methyltransferase n=1 Tax=Kribbella sancticallisti TaxID=460087 RepID=A0ABN2DYX0_9ACTN